MLLLSLLSVKSFAQRYLTPVFSSTTVSSNIQYGSSTNYRGNTQNLLLDFYEPTGDIATERPLIIYVHGGGFIDTNQSKNLVHIVAFSDSMARRGYAVACINYRLDTSISNRAVINAMHDAKAAVRFFKSNRTTCKIDTSLIFIGGESAGAITAMTTTYINKTSEVLYPPSSPQSTNVTVEGNSGNPGFSSQTKAALCFCGGTKTVLNELLFDTSAIEINPNPSLLIIHGTNDPLITTSSSLNLAIRANNVGVPNLFYPMYGATHCPWFFPLTDSWKYLDTLIDYTVPFLYACVQNSTNINEVNKILDVNIYPNPAKNTINIVSKSIDNKSITVTITSLDNKLVYNKKEIINGSKLSIDVANLMSGAYIIKLTSGEEYFYEKIIIQ